MVAQDRKRNGTPDSLVFCALLDYIVTKQCQTLYMPASLDIKGCLSLNKLKWKVIIMASLSEKNMAYNNGIMYKDVIRPKQFHLYRPYHRKSGADSFIRSSIEKSEFYFICRNSFSFITNSYFRLFVGLTLLYSPCATPAIMSPYYTTIIAKSNGFKPIIWTFNIVGVVFYFFW